MKRKVFLSSLLLSCFLVIAGCGADGYEQAVESDQQSGVKVETADSTIESSNAVDSSENVVNQESDASEESQSSEASQDVPETIVISPLPVTIDMEQLDNCTVAVSLEKGDVYVDDTGVIQMEVTVYAYDLYDMVDIARMKEGDTILIRQEEILITALERLDTGMVRINDGQDKGGFDLYTNDNGVFFEIGYSDVKSYYELGTAKLPVSEDFQLYDSMDLDKGEVVFDSEDFIAADSGIIYGFTQHNTSIVIEGGQVTAMYRVYTP